MRKLRFLSMSLFSLLAIFLITSCSDNDEDNGGQENTLASITVAVKGQPTSRAIGSSASNPAVENLVSNFTVFVFDFNSGNLEQAQGFTYADDQLTGRLTGINTGNTKRIVTIVNVPSSFNVSSINNYSQLDANLITLESQNSADIENVGLFMSGQTTDALQLNSGDNAITIPVRRLVAKVILKSVSFSSDPTTLPNYSLSEVSIQKARIDGTTFGDIVAPTGNVTDNYAGGIASPEGADPAFTKTFTFLAESLAIPEGYQAGDNILPSVEDERYFYVLPNDGASNNPTMLTLSGQYGVNITDAYYPIVINGENVEGGSTDGTFIRSNRIYSISVVINHPTSPSNDPNEVPEQSVLTVTITPQNWETPIDQEVEW